MASRTHWISLGDLQHRLGRNDRGCAGVSLMRAFRPPCQRTGAPVRDSQWPGTQEPAEEGDPSAGSCVLWRCLANLNQRSSPLFSILGFCSMQDAPEVHETAPTATWPRSSKAVFRGASDKAAQTCCCEWHRMVNHGVSICVVAAIT